MKTHFLLIFWTFLTLPLGQMISSAELPLPICEDFDDGDLDGWTLHGDARADNVEGVFELTGNTLAPSSFKANQMFEDFVISVDILPQVNGLLASRPGIFARFDPGRRTGYGANLRQSNSTLEIFNYTGGGSFTRLNRETFDIPGDKPLRLTFRGEGEELTAQVLDAENGTLIGVVTASDSTHTSGETGVVLFFPGGEIGRFDNFKAFHPGNPPKVDPPREPTTHRFNPVLNDPSLTITSIDNTMRLSWLGGGELEKWQEQRLTWETVSRASPYAESRQGMSLFRVRDPWESGRSVEAHIPASYDPETPIPLVVLLHGYFHTPSYIESFLFRMKPLAETKRFIYVQPEGLKDDTGNHLWNAVTNRTGLADDLRYLKALVEGIAAAYNVDRKRIYFVGHSNGGAMANDMACRYSELVAGFVNLGGFANLDETFCIPSEPVHALHIGGTEDPRFANRTLPGGEIAPTTPEPEDFVRPSLLESHAIWGAYNQHTSETMDQEATLDLANSPSGIDTHVTRMTGGAPGGATELWTIEGAGHTPSPTKKDTSTVLAESVIDWLLAHPKSP